MRRNELIEAIFASMQAMHRAGAAKFHTSLERYNLTPSQLELLLLVKHAENVSLKELAMNMKLTPGAVSQLVNGLVSGGYVHRQEDPSDRRISQITLSSKGKSNLHKIWDERTSSMMRIMEDLTLEELHLLLRIQRRITAHLESNT